jgi:capsular exopolysaccharide synthesis family protein
MAAALRSALMLALAAGLGIAFSAEMLDRSVASAGEVERKLGVRAIAVTPKLSDRQFRTLAPLHRHPAGYVVEKPMSSFAEAFRVLRASLAYARIDKRVQIVAVTSALAGEGKTTLSLCLARVAATSGRRVALVDCDLRRQSLSDLLGMTSGRGLAAVLAEGKAWKEALRQDDETSLQVLTGPVQTFTPVDVFSSRAMKEFLIEARDQFDLIILDCAPALQVADTRTLAALADLTIVVVRADKTPAAATRSALRELTAAGADIHGVALNCASPASGAGDYYGALYYGDDSYYAG